MRSSRDDHIVRLVASSSGLNWFNSCTAMSPYKAEQAELRAFDDSFQSTAFNCNTVSRDSASFRCDNTDGDCSFNLPV
jgi:hypothetical protein